MGFFDWIFEPAGLASLVTLTVLEVVLGIDNIIFISVIVGRLRPELANRARKIGLALALIFRLALLSVLFLLTGLTAKVVTVFGHGFSWRDIILLAGGLFLIVKATHEIHKDVEGGDGEGSATTMTPSYRGTIAQIIVIDVVFSINSIVTAIGIAEHIGVMVVAVVIAVIIMYVASGAVSSFIERHPTTRMLALSFLLMIGFALVADGFEFHIPRGYLYAAMGFSVLVELLNVIARANRQKKKRVE